MSDQKVTLFWRCKPRQAENASLLPADETAKFALGTHR
jgi:hypothetical protein